MADLERSLSFPVILLITINSIMGTGIFFLPALGAAVAGNASILSWVVMSVVAIGISLVFAELSSMFPTAGGVYEYCKQAFGSFPSFLIGWITLVVSNVTIAMLVVGAVRYLNPLLPPAIKIGASIAFILLFNYMAFRGLQTSAVMLVAFALITLSSVLGLAVPGLFHMDLQHLSPLLTHGAAPVLLTVFLIAETFFGWETATFLAEETQDAERVIPRALVIGTLVIVAIVLLFVVVSLGVIPWSALGASSAPLADIGARIYGAGASPVFSILVYLSIIGSVAGWVVSAPRLTMSLAKDKMFLEQLAHIHPRYKTPYKAIAFQTVLTSVLVVVGSGSYETLLHLLLPLVLVMYSAVILALIVLRSRQPQTRRPFRMPLGVPLSALLALVLVALTLFWGFTDPGALHVVRIGGGLLLAGLPVYLLLKYTYDPDAVISSQKVSGRLSLWLEDWFVPRSLRTHILGLLKLAEKRVLEFGGNVGTLTVHLAERVGPDGILYTTELAKENARIIQGRVAAHPHVRVIHDEHQVNRVHPAVKEVDVVVSVGFLSYVQDIRKVLRDIKERLPENGVVLFVEYVDYFKVLPNAGWTANLDELRSIFAEEGFSVKFEKRRGFLWNYLIIHGIRTDSAVPFI